MIYKLVEKEGINFVRRKINKKSNDNNTKRHDLC
nr:MAG TPA: hypothetical protein [Caudoviricetes sp.]